MDFGSEQERVVIVETRTTKEGLFSYKMNSSLDTGCTLADALRELDRVRDVMARSLISDLE